MAEQVSSWRQRLSLWSKRGRAFLDANPNVFLLTLLFCFSLGLIYKIREPDGSLIFDEVYYVQAARVICGYPVQSEGLPPSWYTGGDFNKEHPPLAKLIMAASLEACGGDSLGWRLPSIVLGLVGMLATYALGKSLTGRLAVARWAVLFLALDNLWFVHSRIATLDIFVASLSCLGVWLYIARRPALSGLVLALATLCKLNGLFAMLGILLYEGISCAMDRWGKQIVRIPWTKLAVLFVCMGSLTYSGLGAMDCYWTEFRHPEDHLKHIVSYGKALSREQGVSPQGIESTPLQWWLNEKNFSYLEVAATSKGNRADAVVFRGILNPYLLGLAPFALCFCLLRARSRSLELLVLCLVVANYGPFLLTYLRFRRITYIYYMVPLLPYLCIAASLMLDACPRWARWVMVIASAYSLAYYFPFK